jgi:uncharacterized protein (UPF0332 family)
MTKQIWELWIKNKKRLDADFQRHIKVKKIKRELDPEYLVRGHLEKADHNLKFAHSTLGLQEFNDWAIVSAYYAIYHASLALCAMKGYSTKDHLATLLILIREFYEVNINLKEIELIRTSTIEKDEVLYYVEAKSKRSSASYSTKILFSREEAKKLQKNAINFVNKAKDIIGSADLKS